MNKSILLSQRLYDTRLPLPGLFEGQNFSKNTPLARSICHETKWLLDLYYSKLNDMFAQSDVLENLFVWQGHMHKLQCSAMNNGVISNSCGLCPTSVCLISRWRWTCKDLQVQINSRNMTSHSFSM